VSDPIVEPGVHVVVDDQLALLSTLGVLILPDGVRGSLTTTYAWQLRVTQALVSGRTTEGSLQRLVRPVRTQPLRGSCSGRSP
jgi:hypothetical protein